MSFKRTGLVAWAVVLLVSAWAGSARAVAPSPFFRPTPSSLSAASPAWTPQMGPKVRISNEGQGGGWPDVAYASHADRYLAVWQRDQSIWGRFLDDRGEPVGEVFEIDRAPDWNDGPPRVAYDPSRNRFLVFWSRLVSGSRLMFGRFVPWSGTDPAQSTFTIDATRPTVSDRYAAAYGSGPDEFLVIWVTEPAGGSETALAARRLKAGGGFASGTSLLTGGSGNRTFPDVAYNAQRNQYLVVYDDYPKVDEHIYGLRLSASGGALGGGEFGIATWPGDEISPSVTTCASEDQYAVVWHGHPSTGGDGLWLRFVSGTGAPGTIKELARYASSAGSDRPLDVACGRTGLLMEDPSYLAAWGMGFIWTGSGLARDVSNIGGLSDTVQFGSHSGATAIAGGDINHLVVWGESWQFQGGDYLDIYARIIGNTRPKAGVTVTPQQGDSNTVFHFDASSSSDATDAAAQLQVRWDLNADGAYDTTWSTTKTIDHQFTLPPGQSWAAQWVTVEVTDGHGMTDKATVIFNLLNTPPVASFSASPAVGDTGTLFQFNASISIDAEDGTPALFRWDWTDDGVYDTPWQSNPIASHRFGSAGTHIVRLEVQDSAGQTASTSRAMVVGPGAPLYPAYLPLVLHHAP